MPKYKGDPPGPTEVIHMNVRNDVMERVKKAHKAGVQKDTSQGAFLGYLVGIGINVYEKQILPAETGDIQFMTGKHIEQVAEKSAKAKKTG